MTDGIQPTVLTKSCALAQAVSVQRKGYLLLTCTRCYEVGVGLTGRFIFPPVSFPALSQDSYP